MECGSAPVAVFSVQGRAIDRAASVAAPGVFEREMSRGWMQCSGREFQSEFPAILPDYVTAFIDSERC